jgi:hypothetical protein
MLFLPSGGSKCGASHCGQTFSVAAGSFHRLAYPGSHQQNGKDEMGRGGRPKQRANVHTTHTDVE